LLPATFLMPTDSDGSESEQVRYKQSVSLPFDLFVGTYRLSSHARLEAFVIQTKLNSLCVRAHTKHCERRRGLHNLFPEVVRRSKELKHALLLIP